MPESRFPPIVALVLLIACLCIYGIILLPQSTFAGMDFLNLAYPRVALARDSLAAGHIPLWNWYEWGGAPLLATWLGALAYPPTWIAMLFSLPYALQVFIFLHLYAAAIGAFLVGRKVFNLSTPASVFCGILFLGNSFWPGRIEQFQVVAVNALLPWLLLSIWSGMKSSRHALWIPAAWAATLLAGHPQFALFNLLASAGIVFLCQLVLPSEPRSTRLKGTFRIVGGLALGTLLAAPQLLPSLELGQLSERIFPYPQPTMPELQWNNLAALVVPRYYSLITGQNGRVFGFTELGVYAGILTIPLAIAGVVAALHSGKPKRSPVIIALIVWLAAMIFALGRHGYVAAWIFEYTPFFKQSRGAARSLNVASLMLAVMAGRGLMALLGLRHLGNNKRKLVIAGILCAATTLDLAAHQLSELRAIMAPTSMLSVRSLLPDVQRNALSTESARIYRFMSFDSDLYLNNSPDAVAERVVRMQPNLNSLSQIGVVDGYEEGLLPTLDRANISRRYNRNLRNDSPDTALLAFMDSNIMLTEFPLDPDQSKWASVSTPFPRPDVVPSIHDGQAVYRYFKSKYNEGMFLDLKILIPSAGKRDFLAACAKAFPSGTNSKVTAAQVWTDHPLELINYQEFMAAQKPFSNVSGLNDWNRLTAMCDGSTTEIIALIPPYPGWKAFDENNEALRLKSLCSLFYTVQLPNKDGMLFSVNLIFSPFSFRLGLFISLAAGMLYLFFLLPLVGRSIGQKIFGQALNE